MATQGATLDRRGMHVPIWPVAALLVIAVATAITVVTLRMVNDAPSSAPVTTVQEFDGTGPRGATLDAMREARAIQAWEAAISELPAGPFHAEGRAHETVVKVVKSDVPAVPGPDCIHCAQQR